MINWDNKNDLSNKFLQKYNTSKARANNATKLKNHTNNIGDNEYLLEINETKN